MTRKAERKGERKSLSAKPADLAPRPIGAKGKVGRPPLETANESLTFKVPLEFKRRFRRYAVERDMRLNQVLVLALEALEEKDAAA